MPVVDCSSMFSTGNPLEIDFLRFLTNFFLIRNGFTGYNLFAPYCFPGAGGFLFFADRFWF